MKSFNDSVIDRCVELTILLVSIVVIAFIITGGCDGEGNRGVQPTPGPTGFPPECGSPNIDLGCPAPSFTSFSCWGYTCGIYEQIGETLEEMDSIGYLVFSGSCEETDCFSLDCTDLMDGSRLVADQAVISIEEVNGTQVSGDLTGQIVFGTEVSGIIVIEEQEFILDCFLGPVP